MNGAREGLLLLDAVERYLNSPRRGRKDRERELRAQMLRVRLAHSEWLVEHGVPGTAFGVTTGAEMASTRGRIKL